MLNKKMLLSVLIIGVVATAAGAGTWAAFSDTEVSTDNTFTAGTLDLQLSNGGEFANGITGFTVDEVFPTDYGTAGTITVMNDGSIDGTITAEIANILDIEDGDSSDAEAEVDNDAAGELSPAVYITVYDGEGISYEGYLASIGSMDFGPLAAGATKTITVDYSIDDVGNEIQGDSVTFDIVFTLNQA